MHRRHLQQAASYKGGEETVSAVGQAYNDNRQYRKHAEHLEVLVRNYKAQEKGAGEDYMLIDELELDVWAGGLRSVAVAILCMRDSQTDLCDNRNYLFFGEFLVPEDTDRIFENIIMNVDNFKLCYSR